MLINTKVAIIIPTLNRKETTLGTIKQLFNNTHKDIQIIICDSGSTDGTHEALSQIDNVTVLNVGKDSWWSAAVNRGVDVAIRDDYECVLVINDDIDFSEDLVEKLLEKSLQYPEKIISPAQQTSSGIFLGIKFLGKWREYKKFWIDGATSCIDVHSTNGCCLLIPVKIFKEVGFFDEKNCPHLFGDTEFQLRALNAGMGTVAFPDIMIAQQANTDYYRRQRLFKLFTFPASPVHVRSYLAFGKALFNGSYLTFFFLGFKHHLAYAISFTKTVVVILNANLKLFGKNK